MKSMWPPPVHLFYDLFLQGGGGGAWPLGPRIRYWLRVYSHRVSALTLGRISLILIAPFTTNMSVNSSISGRSSVKIQVCLGPIKSVNGKPNVQCEYGPSNR